MKKFWLVVLMVLILPAFLFTVSCQKKVAAQDVKAPVVAKPQTPATPTVAAMTAPEFMSEKIYFDFDKSILKPEAQANLKKKAEWLKANANAKLLIEGNCDERGTNEYNMALGERRALSAKKFLTDLGIAADRIKTISYGEEKPVCPQHTEACWTKNRNASFVIFK